MATKKTAKKVLKKVNDGRKARGAKPIPAAKRAFKKRTSNIQVNVQPPADAGIDYTVLAQHIAAEMRRGDLGLSGESCRMKLPNLQSFHGEPHIPVKEYPPEETEDRNILSEATDIVFGDREKMYGDPGKNIRAIAAYWTVHLQQKYGMPGSLTEDDVCQMMISVKQARLLHNPEHRDSQVDTAGYQAVMARIQRHLPF